MTYFLIKIRDILWKSDFEIKCVKIDELLLFNGYVITEQYDIWQIRLKIEICDILLFLFL